MIEVTFTSAAIPEPDPAKRPNPRAKDPHPDATHAAALARPRLGEIRALARDGGIVLLVEHDGAPLSVAFERFGGLSWHEDGSRILDVILRSSRAAPPSIPERADAIAVVVVARNRAICLLAPREPDREELLENEVARLTNENAALRARLPN